MSNQLTAVLPLRVTETGKTNGVEQAEILITSLIRFHAIGHFEQLLVVCRSSDYDELNIWLSAWKAFPVFLVNEDEWLSDHSFLRKVPGWAKQQIIKIVAAKHVNTDFYMTLDADCICTREFKIDEILRNDRAIIQLDPRSTHEQWWRGSAQVIGVDPGISGMGVSVTPVILSREIMRQLMEFLQKKYGGWVEYLCSYYRRTSPNYYKKKVFGTVWTEYTLYHLFLERVSSLEDYHFVAGRDDACLLLSKHSCWHGTNFSDVDPAIMFHDESRAVFAVIQSNLNLDPKVIKTRLADYL